MHSSFWFCGQQVRPSTWLRQKNYMVRLRKRSRHGMQTSVSWVKVLCTTHHSAHVPLGTPYTTLGGEVAVIVSHCCSETQPSNQTSSFLSMETPSLFFAFNLSPLASFLSLSPSVSKSHPSESYLCLLSSFCPLPKSHRP